MQKKNLYFYHAHQINKHAIVLTFFDSEYSKLHFDCGGYFHARIPSNHAQKRLLEKNVHANKLCLFNQ